MSRDPRCQQCARLGDEVALERDPGGNWACPECGMIDQTVTDRVNFVATSALLGSIVDEETALKYKDAFEKDRLQERFDEGVKAILNLYLGIPSPGTAIIDSRGESLRNGARQWLERMREMEQKLYARMHKAMNPNARKMKYFAALAIKFAAQESAIIVLERKLAEGGVRKKKRVLPGYAKGEATVQNPELLDMFNRAHCFSEESFGHMDSLEYLKLMYRRYSRLCHFCLTPLETMLFYVDQIVNRLRYFVDMPHEERLKVLMTLPKVSKGDRDWIPEDFAYFNGLDWSKIIPHAYHLYQIQETCRMWGPQVTPSIAIALTIWAMMSVTGTVMPQYSTFQRELAFFYNRTQWTSAEKFRDMRNLLTAWATSITDAGIPFPVLPLPPKGGIGDGLSGYAGDSRRPIPEIDVAVAALPTIVANWPRILKARLKYRTDVMSMENEMWLARKMFVVSGGIYHFDQFAKEHEKQKGLKPNKRKQIVAKPTKFKTNAEEARKQILEFEPLRRARTRPPFGMYWTAKGANQPTFNSLNQTTIPHVRPTPPPHRQTTFVPPPPEKTIEDLIARPEDSSDEGSANGSDDDTPASAPSGLALINANATATDTQRPFAFTVGPNGFNTETRPLSASQQSIQIANNVRHASGSASELSPSSILMARHRSNGSQSAGGSASEAEAVLPHQSQRLTALQSLNTSSTASSISSPSPPSSQPNQQPSSIMTARNMSSSTTSNGIKSGPRAPLEDAHVGLLIREREEYVQFRLPQYYQSGHVVSVEVEAVMWQWIRSQVQAGSMPKVVDAAYLRTIGIIGNPRRLDLGPWVQMRKARWSPVECLLRAGIRPREIPEQHIPHSVSHCKQLLYHYPDDGFLAPIGQKIDAQQLDKEVDYLFTKEGGDSLDQVFLTDKETKQRNDQYIKTGAWDTDGTPELRNNGKDAQHAGGKHTAKKALPRGEQGQGRFGFDGEEGESDDDTDFEATSSVGGSRSRGSSVARNEAEDLARSTAQAELSKIQRTIRISASQIRSKRDNLDGLMRIMRTGASLNPGQDGEDGLQLEDVDWSEGIIGSLDFGDLGLGDEWSRGEEEGGDEGEDDGGDGESDVLQGVSTGTGQSKPKGRRRQDGEKTSAAKKAKTTAQDNVKKRKAAVEGEETGSTSPKKRTKKVTTKVAQAAPAADTSDSSITAQTSQASMMPPPLMTG